MHLESLGSDAAFAGETIREAVRFLRGMERDAPGGTLTKANGSPVTIADFVSQAFVASRLEQRFPADPLVAEEDAAVLRTEIGREVSGRVVELVGRMLPGGGIEPAQVLAWIDRGRGACGHRFWTLDPVDGTRGLLRGGQYVVALALVVDGTVQIGAIGCPRLSVITAPASQAECGEHVRVAGIEPEVEGGVALAVRGRGAWWMSLHGDHLTRLSVSSQSNPANLRALHSLESRHSDIDELHRVLRELHSQASPIQMDGQTKHVLLAAGAAELLMRIPIDRRYREAIWDQASGALLVEEAGGRVSDLDGRPFDFTTGRQLLRNTGLVASNGLLHDAVLDVVRKRGVR
jgi:3'(2'), 5'-bisphosphate nucleotidase